ncbi:hypothetical protein SAMN05443144_12033 [Fodinibius roseus]|uniref:Flagellar assembly protein FliH n=1 Tax=Fodinibius roseus TaxID=1194090 RepID=A0A1M5HGA0_9BACT|nr:hypothetical protein [Fodinibius roseus]SHG14999.1 hypothetical protein SAMN05443144_12033 [Fodinibius roseus]
MEEPKILHDEQLSWYEEEDRRLDYQVAFENQDYTENKGAAKKAERTGNKEDTDVKKLLRERDRMWKKRLQKAREAAFREGLEKGKKEGISEAREEINEKIKGVEHILDHAHLEWKRRQEAINPGLLDLVFELVEKIVGLPVENPEIRNKLDEELSNLLHEADTSVKPVIWICESDYEYVEGLVNTYAPEVTVSIRSSDKYNPGEFAFDTEKETVVYNFKEMLRDFRETISLPSWR